MYIVKTKKIKNQRYHISYLVRGDNNIAKIITLMKILNAHMHVFAKHITFQKSHLSNIGINYFIFHG